MISQRFIELTQQMRDIHEKKNAGYSGVDNPDSWANFRLCEQFGVSASLGCMVRLSDKYKRACNLLKNTLNEQVGEALEDTLLDLANYSLIMVCLLEEQKESTQNDSVIYPTCQKCQKTQAVDVSDMKSGDSREIECQNCGYGPYYYVKK